MIVTSATISELVSILNGITLDGGTDLEGVEFPSQNYSQKTYACHFLFTDGLSIFNKPTGTIKQRSSVPIQIFNSSPEVDELSLQILAKTTYFLPLFPRLIF